MNEINNKTAQRGRPNRISREIIARAALDMGIQDATLMGVAKKLKVDRSSLYHHVKSRDDVIRLAAEIAVKDLQWQAPGDVSWREELIILTDSLWQLYAQHPGLAQVVQQAKVTPIEGIHAFAESVIRLQQKGFSLNDAVMSVDLLVDMVCDSFLGWWSTDIVEVNGLLRKERLIMLWQQQADLHPNRAEPINAMVAIMHAGSMQWWVNKRDLILDGIALRLDAAK